MSIPPLRYALQPVKSHTFDVQILTTLLTFLFLTGSSKAEGIPDSFTSEVCRFACETALRCKWRITLKFSTISPVNMLPKFSPFLWKSQGYIVCYLVLFQTLFVYSGFQERAASILRLACIFDKVMCSWNDTCFFAFFREKCLRLLPRPLCACSRRSLR